MISGNNAILQVAKDAYTNDTPTAATSGFRQIRFSSASMDYVPNKVREKILTGNIGEARISTLGVKCQGSIASLLRPDDAGFFLYMLLGTQALTNTDVFKFTPNKTALPSFTIKLDKGAGTYTYPGNFLNSLSFSAEPEDFVSFTIEVLGYDESYATTSLSAIAPSQQRAFKFHQGKVYFGGAELADVTSINFSYSNSLENIQTTSTGLHYKKPTPNTRVITADISCLYSTASETFRQNYFKTDNLFSLKLTFQTDEGASGDLHVLTIEIPNCQVTSCSVPISDANAVKQNISLSAIDIGSGDLISVLLDNGLTALY